MFETIYEWVFIPENYEAFTQGHGYDYAGWTMVLTSIIIGSIYYFYFGNKSSKYATVPKWSFSLLLNGLLIFIITGNSVGFSAIGVQSFGEIPGEVWIFSIYNMFYSFIFYFAISLGLKRFSSHAKYTPLKK